MIIKNTIIFHIIDDIKRWFISRYTMKHCEALKTYSNALTGTYYVDKYGVVWFGYKWFIRVRSAYN